MNAFIRLLIVLNLEDLVNMNVRQASGIDESVCIDIESKAVPKAVGQGGDCFRYV